MDTQRSSLLLNWNYFHQQQKSMDHELRESLALTMELEDTKLKAQHELKIRDEQISQLKHLLARVIQERDLAQHSCHKLALHHRRRHHSAQYSEDARPESNNAFSSSDCDESIVSSPASDLPVPVDGPLPEQGNLLQAVMRAGPLLQTLLVAGQMPQWRHPPPPLDTYQIPTPPVAIPNQETPNGNCGKVLSQRKRGFCEGSESSSAEFKYQRVLHH